MARLMASTRLRSLAIGAAALAGAVTLSACGSTGSADADLANGKQKFTQSCGSCHIMKDAGTTGTAGPNLDDAFRGPRAEGFAASHFEGVVRYWIANAEQKRDPIMPRNLVTGNDARDVAAYVAVYAGAGSKPGELTESPVVQAAK